MNRYEQLTSKTINELALWIDINSQHDDSPWMTWFNETYCDKCNPEIVYAEDSLSKLGFQLLYKNNTECSYCEVYQECRFFNGKNPSTLEIIEMWLKEDVEENIL